MNKIFLTVDTESHNLEMENQYIWGKKGNSEHGIRRILELGKQYSIPINFFMDFAERDRYGKNFIEKIVNAIKEYNQPVFLHLHPNYISGDEERSYLWQYTEEEQRKILERGIEIYQETMGKNPVAFRAGRYGADEHTYDLLDQLLPGILEFSYTGGYGKMCHVREELIDTKNHFSHYKSLNVMPNCSFIALDLPGFRKSIGVDTSEMSLTEFREFIEVADGKDFVLTMHSWNFINRFFWSKDYVGRNRTNERLFVGMIRIAREHGYEFEAIDQYDFESGGSTEDISYNACEGVGRKIRSLGLNFWRFQQIAKISKKYLMIYSGFYAAMLLGAAFLINMIMKRN